MLSVDVKGFVPVRPEISGMMWHYLETSLLRGWAVDVPGERFLGVVGATLDAEIARAEDLAAADLAASLTHDVPFAARARHIGTCSVLLPGGGKAPVRAVGPDVVYTDDGDLVPLRAATIVGDGNGRPPAMSSRSFAAALRRLARERSDVVISTSQRRWPGVIEAAASDHLLVRLDRGYVAVPSTEVVMVSPARKGARRGS